MAAMQQDQVPDSAGPVSHLARGADDCKSHARHDPAAAGGEATGEIDLGNSDGPTESARLT